MRVMLRRNEAAILALLGAGAFAKSPYVGKLGGAFGKATGIVKVVASGVGGKMMAFALVISAIGFGASAWRASPRTSSPQAPPIASTSNSPAQAMAVPLAPSETSLEKEAPPPAPCARLTSREPVTDHDRSKPLRDQNATISRSAASRASVRLDVEVALIRDGTTHLNAGDPIAALDAFDEHARLFPHGALAEERAAGRVRALCRLGRTSEAQSEAARFLASHPASPHAGSVRAACAR